MTDKHQAKQDFKQALSAFAHGLVQYIATPDKQWVVKGFVDVFRNVYSLSGDTKIVSKILEIHLFPKILDFAEEQGFIVVLADHQNYYPDISFVSKHDASIKFAVDFKTTYRLPDKPHFCNGFTLGSHGEYFVNRTSRKNIQFPYSEYCGHFCLGSIYSRLNTSETSMYRIEDIEAITSVIADFQCFATEKWEIASDSSGSGNTANIGSIKVIKDILHGNGVFKPFGEEWFDDYWCNYGKIVVPNEKGELQKIRSLETFLQYRGYEQKATPRKAQTNKPGGGT
ncbi:MAG: restriction endonuclease [Candidatus Kapaibacterium sp.]|nr:MAG: restriction endonuclease [Candidatus Kapabacteria bacterium]